MIVEIEFFDKEGTPWKMLFGNNPNWRNWDGELQQYFWENIKWWDETRCMKREIYGIGKMRVSKSRWMAWGGLKWCHPDKFQAQLDREGCQQSDPDNPRPRQFRKMKFQDAPEKWHIAHGMYVNSIRHLPDLYSKEPV